MDHFGDVDFTFQSSIQSYITLCISSWPWSLLSLLILINKSAFYRDTFYSIFVYKLRTLTSRSVPYYISIALLESVTNSQIDHHFCNLLFSEDNENVTSWLGQTKKIDARLQSYKGFPHLEVHCMQIAFLCARWRIMIPNLEFHSKTPKTDFIYFLIKL